MGPRPAAQAAVGYGASATLSGTLSGGHSSQSVEIQAQACGQAAFKKLASVSTTAGPVVGAFIYTAKPTIDTTYQAKLKGSTSPSVTVKVAPLLTLQRRALGQRGVVVGVAQLVGQGGDRVEAAGEVHEDAAVSPDGSHAERPAPLPVARLGVDPVLVDGPPGQPGQRG